MLRQATYNNTTATVVYRSSCLRYAETAYAVTDAAQTNVRTFAAADSADADAVAGIRVLQTAATHYTAAGGIVPSSQHRLWHRNLALKLRMTSS